MATDELKRLEVTAGRQFSGQRSTTSEPTTQRLRDKPYLRQGPPGYEWCDWEGVRDADKFIAEIEPQLLPGVVEPRFPFLITGGVGVGKTGLASVLYRISKRPIWRRADTFLLDLSTGRGDDTYKSERRKADEAKLLVLDDLGVRKPSEGMFHMLFDILETRKAVPTVITSNKSLDELCDQYVDGRLYSRFARGKVFSMTGNDRRLNEDSSVDVYQI